MRRQDEGTFRRHTHIPSRSLTYTTEMHETYGSEWITIDSQSWMLGFFGTKELLWHHLHPGGTKQASIRSFPLEFRYDTDIF